MKVNVSLSTNLTRRSYSILAKPNNLSSPDKKILVIRVVVNDPFFNNTVRPQMMSYFGGNTPIIRVGSSQKDEIAAYAEDGTYSTVITIGTVANQTEAKQRRDIIHYCLTGSTN